MKESIQARMAEATRLTREGRLEEATGIIQRALGNPLPTMSPNAGTNPAGGTIDVTSRLVRETPAGPAHRGPDTFTRPAPGPTFRSGGVRRPSGGTAGASATVPGKGMFVEISYANAAGTRSYKLYVPAGYVGEAVPLVVMLHGCTQDPDDFAAGTRMNELAEEHTFLVAYPAQAAGANVQRCWNWFQAADQRRGSGEPSLIAGIARQVIDEYEVAEDKVYVAGMSAGGAMAAIMGSAYPDLFAAVGVHSGLAPGSAHDLPSSFAAMRQGGPAPVRSTTGGRAKAVPTILFHGDRDATVHHRNGDNLLSHLTAGDPEGGDGASPRVTTRQGSVPGGHSFTRISYRDANGRSVVERWTVHGLGHAWSGGSHPGSYTDPKGPDASAEMVRFFEQHPRR